MGRSRGKTRGKTSWWTEGKTYEKPHTEANQARTSSLMYDNIFCINIVFFGPVKVNGNTPILYVGNNGDNAFGDYP